MAKLSYMEHMIKTYLGLYGDKEVTSISTHDATSEVEYTLNLHDVYDGPISSNPFSGKSEIKLYRKKDAEDLMLHHASEEDFGFYYDFCKDIHENEKLSFAEKAIAVWGALTMLRCDGKINVRRMQELWFVFAAEELGL